MKKPFTLFALVTVLLLAWLSLPDITVAQAPPPPPDKPVQNPIDGGLALLAVAGGAYAVKKLTHRSLGEGELRDRKE